MKYSKSRMGRIALIFLSIVLIGLKLFSVDIHASQRSVDYYEGHRLWVEFLDSIEHVRGVDGWYNNQAGLNVATNWGLQLMPRTFFIEHLGYGGEDDWDSLDLFDRYIWTNIYIQPLLQIYYNLDPLIMLAMGGFISNFFESYDGLPSFINEVGTTHFYHILENLGTQNAVVAYENLMIWQYHHIMATGTVFDFTTGLKNTVFFQPNITPIEVTPPHPSLFGFNIGTDNSTDPIDLDQYDIDDIEIPDEVLDGILGVLDGTADAMGTVGNAIGGLINTDTDRGIWDNFLAFFGNNIIILSILGVLLVALGMFIIIRKRRAMK